MKEGDLNKQTEEAKPDLPVPTDNTESIESVESEWPSDYYECIRPIFSIKGIDAWTKSVEHNNKYQETKNKKELVTALLLAARHDLTYSFMINDLTLMEIKSLVEIANKIAPEFEKKSPNLILGTEMLSHWLWDNYGIDWTWERKQVNKEKIESSRSRDDYLEIFDEREQIFAEYVRKTREKALIPEKKD